MSVKRRIKAARKGIYARKGETVLVEKTLDKVCPDCGEMMVLALDHGAQGEAYECAACGFYEETIDLRAQTTPDPRA
jgi:predicted RNA-binding Zn-ribbon protein involved in translation (DUF1610 family)